MAFSGDVCNPVSTLVAGFQRIVRFDEDEIVTRRSLFVLLAALSLVRPFVTGEGTNPAARPDFNGIWNSGTATPLERPVQLKDKPFFTPEEAAAWERQIANRNQEPSPEAASKSTSTGTYNTFFREFGIRTVKTLRTSIITDPPDGRIPALTPAAAEVKLRRLAGIKNPASAQETGLQDRCLAFVTAGPPLLPYSYNSNYWIVQARDVITVHAEMIHDTRFIYIYGRPHLPPSIRLWMGHSVGRWEGATLVVTRRTSTTAPASMGTRVATSDGTGIFTSSSGSVF